jgi:hypothetical protein
MAYSYLVLGAGRQGLAAAYDLASFGEASQVTLADILERCNPGSSWSKLIKPVSGCAFAHLSNVAPTRKAPPVIIYSHGAPE